MALHPERSVVAVYGIRHGDDQPSRLGNGFLPHELVVGLKGALKQEMSSDHPPQILRVGIANTQDDGQMFVEVIEVLQVVQSTDHTPVLWAAELQTPAQSPTNPEAAADEGWDIRNGLCALLSLSFC